MKKIIPALLMIISLPLLSAEPLETPESIDFLQAAASGDVVKIKAMIDSGVSPDIRGLMRKLIPFYPSVNGWTALMTAAYLDNAELAELLLESGADPDLLCGEGKTAIFRAAQTGSLNVMKLLIEAEADLNRPGYPGESPLFKAAAMGFVEAVEILLEKDSGGDSVLLAAAQSSSFSTLKFLLDKGFKPDDSVLLEVSKRRKPYSAIKLLLEKDPDPVRVSGRDALYNLIEQGDSAAFKLLLDAGAEPEPRMFEAASNAGRAGIIRILLDAGIGSDFYCSELTAAAFSGDTMKIRKLIDNGASINERDRLGRTVLIASAMAGCKDVVELSLSSGADVNYEYKPPDSLKQTALLIAVSGSYHDICSMLLDSGADPARPDDDPGRPGSGSFKPLHAAAVLGDTDIIEMLLENKGLPADAKYALFTPLFYAVENNFAAAVKLFLKHGADVFHYFPMNLTYLHYAVMNDSRDVVAPLVEAGLDINSRTLFGHTPLYYTRARGMKEMRELLISLGAVE